MVLLASMVPQQIACIFAVTGLLKEMPDMVVSGINEGSNLSDDILYSGTVAAAVEGVFRITVDCNFFSRTKMCK